MPLVHSCSEPGCSVLTMGRFCVDHEQASAERGPVPSRGIAFAALVGAAAVFVAAFAARTRLPL